MPPVGRRNSMFHRAGCDEQRRGHLPESPRERSIGFRDLDDCALRRNARHIRERLGVAMPAQQKSFDPGIHPFIERTKRSAYAFKFGDLGGRRMTFVPVSPMSRRNCSEYLLSRSIIRLCSAVIRSNSRYGRLLLHDAHYAHAGPNASEYSWCKPPKIDRTRTSASVTNRWRDSDFRATTDSSGGSGTLGPNEL
jgi:hypothetical protein